MQNLRDALFEAIDTAFTENQRTLIEALPAMGKSHNVVEWAAKSGKPLTVLTSRHGLYDQYSDWAEESELSHLQLPSFHKDCPTMSGEEGEKGEIEQAIGEVYRTGITGKQIHEHPERYVGEPLPCQQDGRCPYIEKREFDPAEYNVLIGHYLQAHNPNYIEERYVAVDEFPQDSYLFTPSHDTVARAVSSYLEKEEDLPFDNWKELWRNTENPEAREQFEEWKDEASSYDPRETRLSHQNSPGYHARAPLMIRAAFNFELLDNQWEYADLGQGRVAVRSPEDDWAFLVPPPFYLAESVIALDGTPTVGMWRLALGGEYIQHEEIPDTYQKKRQYLRELLGMEIVQTSAGTKPYHSGNHINVESDGALLEAVDNRHEESPSVITTTEAEEAYEEAGVYEFIDESDHYGAVKGMNDYSEKRLGAVIGAPHPNESKTIERWGALNGEAVGRVEDEEGISKGENLDFGSPFGNALYHHFVHNEVLQSVLRFGREEDDDGDRWARVYVHTSCLPKWVHPEYRVSVKTWSDGMEEVVETIQEMDDWPSGGVTNSEIAERTSITARRVRDLMKELSEMGYVTYRRGGRGNAYHWSDICIEEFNRFGHTEI